MEEEPTPPSASIETPKTSWVHNPITLSTVVIAIATVVNLVVSFGLWLSTKDSVEVATHVFEAANRPYVGLDSFSVRNNREKKNIHFIAEVKNFGTAPAEQADIRWEMLFNGVIQPSTGIPANASTLFPSQQPRGMYAGIGTQTYEQIMSRQITLTFILRASYNGPADKSYRYCNKGQYDPQIDKILDLGTCDEEKPAGKAGSQQPAYSK